MHSNSSIPFVTPPGKGASHNSSGKQLIRGEHILLVDDNAAIREIIQCTLEHFGFKTTAANNGIMALQIFNANSGLINLVLTDIRMPEMDGVQLIKELRRVKPSLPIIAMSGYSETTASSKQEIAFSIPFLTKPFPLNTLLDTIIQELTKVEKSQ